MLLRKNVIVSFILLSLSFNTGKLFSQQTISGLSSNLNPDPAQRNILEDRDQWIEIESQRAVYSSAYKTPDGRIIMHYSKEPLNYYNANGKLVPIVNIPEKTSDGLSANDQPFPVSVLNNSSVEINTGENKIIYSGNCKINGVAARSSEIKQDRAIATMKDIVPGIDKTFDFRFNSLKYNYVLTHPVANSSENFIIEEEIDLPKGASIQPDINYGKKDKNGWIGVLSVSSGKGEEISRINGALCFDANKNYCAAAYKLENENGIQKLKIVIPENWLSDASRVYPITIDPLVTGPTSTWAGSFIPSCIAPASSADSIAVTIPAQISITGFFCSGSYYASPFTTAVMSQGSMFFSTSCNTSTSFTVAAPTGSTPGTGYLTAFDLHSPLLCCYPQSCSARTIYLTMHISRTGPGTGCNTTYIYHDPFSGYPFSAYVEGRTVETFGPGWNVTPNTVCSNVCNLAGSVYIRYGVPPYTITHPWMTGSVTAGAIAGCSTGSIIKVLNLVNPSCPITCDTITVLSVPPPTVTDACGNVLTGLVPKVIHIKETPVVTATPNPATECSDVPFTLTLNSCIPGSTINWSGHGSSGTGTFITDAVNNTGTTSSVTNYTITATSNGCVSDTLIAAVNTDPLPVAAFSVSPQPVIINTLANFTDNTSVFGGAANSWLWDFGDGTPTFSSQNVSHSYPLPGNYTVCLSMQTSNGCVDTFCNDVKVIPAEIIVPNVITPNGDGLNDLLYFKYLEFFGNNTLKVFDRWGKIVYEKENYMNDWNASKVSDGTYYYILTLENGKTYPNYIQIIHK